MLTQGLIRSYFEGVAIYNGQSNTKCEKHAWPSVCGSGAWWAGSMPARIIIYKRSCSELYLKKHLTGNTSTKNGQANLGGRGAPNCICAMTLILCYHNGCVKLYRVMFTLRKLHTTLS